MLDTAIFVGGTELPQLRGTGDVPTEHLTCHADSHLTVTIGMHEPSCGSAV